MRIRIAFTVRKLPAFLDFNHTYWLASVIYQAISYADAELATELHKSSQFKFFTFSRLLVKDRKFEIVKESGQMKLLTSDVYFFFSSPRKYLCACLIDGLLQNPDVKIGDTEFLVANIRVLKEKELGRKSRFVTLSPINVTAVEGENGKIKAVDLYPNTPKFYENLKENLIKKYMAFYGEKPKKEEIKFNVRKSKPVRIRVKDTYHRASLMVFDAEGSKELLEMGYKAGFGCKTSMGFGMVKVI